jgi:lactate dehydrogenase-like 2-hydroxyacid dehydrogenase
MLAEADVVAVAAPLTAATAGMLRPDEFAAMQRGVLYVNVSRGAIA